MGEHDQIMYGARQLDATLQKLALRLKGDHHEHFKEDDRARMEALEERVEQYKQAFEICEAASQLMTAQQKKFFFENLELGLFMDFHPTKAALLLTQALGTYPDDKALQLVNEAKKTLEQLELDLQRAQQPPFENWYRETWIRRKDSRTNPHYSLNRLTHFLETYEPRYK